MLLDMNFRTAILQGLAVAVIATGAGYVGSSLHEFVRDRQNRWAPSRSSDVVKATRFEVVSEDGRLLSYWALIAIPKFRRLLHGVCC